MHLVKFYLFFLINSVFLNFFSAKKLYIAKTLVSVEHYACRRVKKIKFTALEKIKFHPNIQKIVVISKIFFNLYVADQIENIHSKLCYHARFFTATDSTKSKQR